jgi:hypothetical protein
MRDFGQDSFWKVFVRRMKEAFDRYKANKKKSLNEKRFEWNPSLLSRYRYPPRIFSRKPITQFGSGMSFEFHYLNADDKRFVLRQLDNWTMAFHLERLGSQSVLTFRRFACSTTKEWSSARSRR